MNKYEAVLIYFMAGWLALGAIGYIVGHIVTSVQGDEK